MKKFRLDEHPKRKPTLPDEDYFASLPDRVMERIVAKQDARLHPLLRWYQVAMPLAAALAIFCGIWLYGLQISGGSRQQTKAPEVVQTHLPEATSVKSPLETLTTDELEAFVIQEDISAHELYSLMASDHQASADEPSAVEQVILEEEIDLKDLELYF